jgi:hypothetical protein
MAGTHKRNTSGLIPFKKGPDERRNTEGAPKKFINSIRDYGYKPGEIIDVLNTMVTLRIDQIQKIEKAQDGTYLERIIAKVLIKDFNKGTMWNVNSILDRIVGLPKQTTEIKEPVDYSKLKVEIVAAETTTFASKESEVDIPPPPTATPVPKAN